MGSEYDLGGRQSWPTMFFYRKWKDHPAESAAITRYLYQLRDASKSRIESGVAHAAKSAGGIYESDFDLFLRDDPGLRKLVAWCEESVAQAVSVANGQRFRPEQLRVEFPEAWFHITNNGGFHDAHYHGGCSWCGIFYVQSGDASPSSGAGAGNGISRFYSPQATGGLLKDVGNAYLSSNRVDITPADGLLMLFPAYLLHSGLPYKGKQDRIVIAFNSRTFMR
jgi:uncharacterized protein (TIGR02466 family)